MQTFTGLFLPVKKVERQKKETGSSLIFKSRPAVGKPSLGGGELYFWPDLWSSDPQGKRDIFSQAEDSGENKLWCDTCTNFNRQFFSSFLFRDQLRKLMYN